MVHLLTIKELSLYLKPQEITIREYASQDLITAIGIVPVRRFDKDVIDDWTRID